MPAYVEMQSLYPVSESPSIFTIGGYGIKHVSGAFFGFDFEEMEASADFTDDGYLKMSIRLKSFDVDCYPDSVHLTNDILKDSHFTEVNYECYGKEETEEEFIPLLLTGFEMDTWIDDNTHLSYDFQNSQMEYIQKKEKEYWV